VGVVELAVVVVVVLEQCKHFQTKRIFWLGM